MLVFIELLSERIYVDSYKDLHNSFRQCDTLILELCTFDT